MSCDFNIKAIQTSYFLLLGGQTIVSFGEYIHSFPSFLLSSFQTFACCSKVTNSPARNWLSCSSSAFIGFETTTFSSLRDCDTIFMCCSMSHIKPTNQTLVKLWLFLTPSIRCFAPSSWNGLQPSLLCRGN